MKGKTILVFFLCLFLIRNVYSQQLYLSSKIISDSVSLKQYMPVLAGQIIKRLDQTPKANRDGEYYGSLFAVQTMAGQYEKSLESIDSIRAVLPKLAGVSSDDASGYLTIYNTYNHIKLMQKGGDKRSDIELFKWSFPIVLDNFKGKAFTFAAEPFAYTPTGAEAEWKKALTQVRARRTDSVSLDSAIMFSQAYLQYIVYKPFLDEGKKIVYSVDNANFIVQDSVMITMHDGAKIAAVIARDRKTTQPQPVVLMSTIYASTDEVSSAKQIASHGYVGIILNIRGKYIAGPAIVPWEHDAEDLYDAIDWISKQSWCNGKVGMYGGSYLGFTQWAATKKLHPALKTIVPQAAAAPGIDFPAHNGIFTAYNYSWLKSVTRDQYNGLQFLLDSSSYWTSLFNKWYASDKAFNSVDTLDGQPNAIFQRWLKHPVTDKFWQSTIPHQHDFGKINIPVLTITGYFDGEQLGALYYYKEHHRWNAAANHYLVIGPYDHVGAGSGAISPVLGGYPIDDVANINVDDLIFKWFDYTLKDGAKPQLLKDSVNYEVMGANTWGHSSSLKKLNNSSVNFYLSNDKAGKYYRLNTQKTTGFIAQQVDFSIRKQDKIAYNVNAANLLADTLDTSGGITFISDVLKDDFTITGSFKANLLAAINKKDMDIVMSLQVQQPDGKYLSLSYTLQRASYAKDRGKRNLLKPGVKELIPLEGAFTAVKVLKGSRLVVAIGVLNSAGSEVNYGTGRDVATETIKDAKDPLQIKWYGDSLIQIPVNK